MSNSHLGVQDTVGAMKHQFPATPHPAPIIRYQKCENKIEYTQRWDRSLPRILHCLIMIVYNYIIILTVELSRRHTFDLLGQF